MSSVAWQVGVELVGGSHMSSVGWQVGRSHLSSAFGVVRLFIGSSAIVCLVSVRVSGWVGLGLTSAWEGGSIASIGCNVSGTLFSVKDIIVAGVVDMTTGILLFVISVSLSFRFSSSLVGVPGFSIGSASMLGDVGLLIGLSGRLRISLRRSSTSMLLELNSVCKSSSGLLSKRIVISWMDSGLFV